MATTAAEASMTAVRWRALVSVERGRRAIAAARDGDQMAADLDRAVERLEVAEAALADAAYGSAAEAGEAAALAAEPRLEPLLDRARRRVDEADAAFDDGRYDDAIGAWEAARELYERARTLARERDEEPMAERLAESIGRLRENVAGAEQQRANERMRALAAEATEAVDDGDERFDDGEYDAARDRFERAADTYREAADLAAEHGFEDEKQLREGAERAAESAGDCRLAALADRLDDAEEALDGAEGIDDAPAVREAFESVADDLSELSVPEHTAGSSKRVLAPVVP
jgi:phage shock protein A